MQNQLPPTTKQFTDDLLSWIRGKGKTIILVHDNPDPDCMASAMALRHMLIMKLNTDPVIAFTGMIGRSENIAMAKQLELPLVPFELVNLKDYPVVCMLDTQPETGNNSLPVGHHIDLLIDHHPLREASLRSRWLDVREEYGVTATILYEYLLAQEIYISTKLATALFYAIKSETQDLGREANRPDRDAYLRLFPLTNKKLLYEITHPKLPKEYFLSINHALENTTIYGSILVSNMLCISFPEVVAEIADYLVRLEGIDSALCMGHYNDGMILSLRTTRHDINAGGVLRNIVLGIGSAGGHGMMAGGKVEHVPATEGAMRDTEQILVQRLLQELAAEQSVSHRLIPDVSQK